MTTDRTGTTVLGIDPGTRNVGWAVTRDGAHHASGIVTCDGKHPWPQTRAHLLTRLQQIIADYRPDLVVVEQTQMSGRGDQGRSEQAVFSMGLHTQRTEELAGQILVAAVQAGAVIVRVHPQTGLRALGLKRGVTDGQVAKMFLAITGLKLRATEAHQARALGVAFAGEQVLRLGKAGGAR